MEGFKHVYNVFEVQIPKNTEQVVHLHEAVPFKTLKELNKLLLLMALLLCLS